MLCACTFDLPGSLCIVIVFFLFIKLNFSKWYLLLSVWLYLLIVIKVNSYGFSHPCLLLEYLLEIPQWNQPSVIFCRHIDRYCIMWRNVWLVSFVSFSLSQLLFFKFKSNKVWLQHYYRIRFYFLKKKLFVVLYSGRKTFAENSWCQTPIAFAF